MGPLVSRSCGTAPRDGLPLSLTLSNKPNPNQISASNVKAGVVNGAGAPGQSPGAGRACESCYSKCPPRASGPTRALGALCRPGVLAGGARRAGDAVMLSAVRRFCLRTRLSPTLLSVAAQSYQWYSWGPPNMQCRLCASCWTYWKKYGGLKMPTRLDGERPGPNRSNMVSGRPSPPPCPAGRAARGHGAVSGRRAPFRRAPTASQPGAAGAPSLP